MALFDGLVYNRWFKSNVEAEDSDEAFDKIALVAWKMGPRWYYTWLLEGHCKQVFKGSG